MSYKKLVWLEEFSVHDAVLDEQHKHLCEVANEIISLAEEKTQSSTEDEKLLILLTKLGDNALYHFDTEEKLLKQTHAAGAEEHIKKHTFYRKEIREFIASMRSSSRDTNTLKKDVADFVYNWVSTHMLRSVEGETRKG